MFQHFNSIGWRSSSRARNGLQSNPCPRAGLSNMLGIPNTATCAIQGKMSSCFYSDCLTCLTGEANLARKGAKAPAAKRAAIHGTRAAIHGTWPNRILPLGSCLEAPQWNASREARPTLPLQGIVTVDVVSIILQGVQSIFFEPAAWAGRLNYIVTQIPNTSEHDNFIHPVQRSHEPTPPLQTGSLPAVPHSQFPTESSSNQRQQLPITEAQTHAATPLEPEAGKHIANFRPREPSQGL